LTLLATLPVIEDKDVEIKTSTHCPYCAFQCGMNIVGSRENAKIEGNDSFPVNRGRMCIKGWTSTELLNHPERLSTPLIRNSNNILVSTSWEKALDTIADRFKDIQSKYGRDALGIFGSGALTNEKAYLLGKFARIALGTSNIDYNGRFCMSSAAAASNKAFGIDRGLPFPVSDIAKAEIVLLVGSNIADTMPPLMQYFEQQRANGGKFIVVDPRRSNTASAATLHLKLTPGTDAALANGILHVLIRDGYIDTNYIRERTEGFDSVKSSVASYWPERVERICGVPSSEIEKAAYMLGTVRTAMILTGRGTEQQSQGVNNTLSFINIALALGMVGKPYSGYGCLTGQGNGQGGREHGQKADQLPGYRKIDNPTDRQYIAKVWGVGEEELPRTGKSAYEMLSQMGEDGGVRGLMVMGSNILVSTPNANHIENRLKALDFLVVSDFFLSETAELADVVLPTAQWAEEEGTMTNLEGRVILRKQAFAPPFNIYSDIRILCELAKRLGKEDKFTFINTEEIFNELRIATAGAIADYSGITYEKISESNGIFWPCPSEEHTGTSRLFTDKFHTPNGRARFHAIRHLPSAEEPDKEYPLYLTTGRVLAHYQSGTQTRRVAKLQEMASEPFAEINPATARRYGLSHGDLILLETRRGEAIFKAKLTNLIREDTIFIPFHWGGKQSGNRLTNGALDPTSRMPEFKVCAVRIKEIISNG
jgi:assimilatory nitrate reductase catalytic subunit